MRSIAYVRWFGRWGVREDTEHGVWLVGRMVGGWFSVEWDFLTHDQAVLKAREMWHSEG